MGAAPPSADAGNGDASAVLAAYRKALDVIEGDPDLMAALVDSPSIELETQDDGSIEVEIGSVSSTILASELTADDAPPAPAAPMPPAAA